MTTGDNHKASDSQHRLSDQVSANTHQSLELGDAGGGQPVLLRIPWLKLANIDLDPGKHLAQGWAPDRAEYRERGILAKLTTRIFRLLAPRTGDDRSRIFLQQLARGLGPGTPLAKRPVELDKRDAEAFQLGTDLVERSLGRAG